MINTEAYLKKKKNKKREYRKNGYHNMPEEKQRLKEYQKEKSREHYKKLSQEEKEKKSVKK